MRRQLLLILLIVSVPAKLALASPSDLPSLLERLIHIDHRIAAAKYQAEAAKQTIRQRQANWLPQVAVRASVNGEQIHSGSTHSESKIGQQQIGVNQLIYDFGNTNANIQNAKDKYMQAELNLEFLKQEVTLEGATVYLQVLRAAKSYNYAKHYEKNVKQQLELEEKRLAKGSGYATDILEVQAQLLGAKATVVEAKGQLQVAINNFVQVFQEPPVNIKSFEQPCVPLIFHLTEQQAVEIALIENPLLKNLRYGIAAKKQDILSAQSKFFPTLNATYGFQRTNDLGGDGTNLTEHEETVSLSYPIFNGGSDIAAWHEAVDNYQSTEQSLLQEERVVVKNVKNDWERWEIAKERAKYLDKQAVALQKFLQLAIKERQFGRKSIVALLVADTNYINALNAGIAAHIEVGIAEYTLLKDMGKLHLGVFQSSPGPVKLPKVLLFRS